MKKFLLLFVLLVIVSTACRKKITEGNALFVGEWVAVDKELNIESNGAAYYMENTGDGTRQITGRIIFEDSRITVKNLFKQEIFYVDLSPVPNIDSSYDNSNWFYGLYNYYMILDGEKFYRY